MKKGAIEDWTRWMEKTGLRHPRRRPVFFCDLDLTSVVKKKCGLKNVDAVRCDFFRFGIIRCRRGEMRKTETKNN